MLTVFPPTAGKHHIDPSSVSRRFFTRLFPDHVRKFARLGQTKISDPLYPHCDKCMEYELHLFRVYHLNEQFPCLQCERVQRVRHFRDIILVDKRDKESEKRQRYYFKATAFPDTISAPDLEVFVEAREYGGVVDERISGQGGLPLGTAGKAVALLSAGIDSPVAAWLMMKRGVVISGLFMDGGRWAGPATRDLAMDNVRILSTWCPGRGIPLWIANLEPFFDAMTTSCDRHYTCLFCKRFMMRVAEGVAELNKMEGVVSGENLGQVASQTLQNMGVITASVKIPVLRPLLTYDKEEIVSIARRIGTYHESPGDTGCLAVPKKPATRSAQELIDSEEKKVDMDKLVLEAVQSAELWIAKDGEIFQKILSE